MVVEDGKIRPADVDAVVNAWLEKLPDETGRARATRTAP